MIPYSRSDVQSEVDKASSVACEYYGVSKADILNTRKRVGALGSARRLMIYLAYNAMPGMNFYYLSQIMGKDRSAMIAGYNRVKSLINRNPTFKARIERMHARRNKVG